MLNVEVLLESIRIRVRIWALKRRAKRILKQIDGVHEFYMAREIDDLSRAEVLEAELKLILQHLEKVDPTFPVTN